MSTTQRLPMLTPWRTLHRMWTHFASKWELPTKIEQAITQTRKACERDFEERLREWYRIWFDEGYQQACRDLPICKVQPAPLALPPPLGIRERAALHKQRLVPDPPPHVLPPLPTEQPKSAVYEPPEKQTGPISHSGDTSDPDDTEEYKALSQLRHEGRGKAS